jgi:bifunctional UDP-N-acetylglucosamine pyrophosphorylase / glucosamine-1-phosphate N-acetyltransferase
VQDVPSGALAVSRVPQRNVAGWVAKKRPGTKSAAAAGDASGDGAGGAPGDAAGDEPNMS